jgi:hypothetical protein
MQKPALNDVPILEPLRRRWSPVAFLAWASFDVGQSMAHLSIEAGDLGLFVHQMAGFDNPAAVQALGVPASHAVVSAFVIGEGVEHEGQIPEALRERERQPRVRKPTSSFLFKGRFAA